MKIDSVMGAFEWHRLFKNKKMVRSIALLCAASSYGSYSYAQDTLGSADVEIPAISRSVHLVENGTYTNQTIPVMRTTADGRVALNFKRGAEFSLNIPERMTMNFQDSPNGAHILSDNVQLPIGAVAVTDGLVRYDISNYNNGNPTPSGHVAMCETNRDAEGNIQNPYACGANGADDCYDANIIAGRTQSGSVRLVETPITIVVSNPKTVNAQIREVQFGTIRRGTVGLPGSTVWLEPNISEDGHLIALRKVNSRFTWNNAVTGSNVTGRYDIAYLPGSDDPAMACNIDQWTTIKPIAHAPFDPAVNDRYGFAEQQFRDPTGALIPNGRDLSGSYPWMDVSGNNFGFSTTTTNITNEPLNVVCGPAGAGCTMAQLRNRTANLMSKTVIGKWTNHKMVLVDTLINNVDYSGVALTEDQQREIAMYTPNSLNGAGGDGFVRVGSGRDTRGAPGLYGQSRNSTFIDSIENKLNFWENMRPETPRDVVWHLSTGVATDEFAFDDYMLAQGFIISDMVQATVDRGNTSMLNYNGLNNGLTRVQNGASSTNWDIPRWGELMNSRIERVAMGGIRGKGAWMNDNSYIQYDITAQPTNVRNSDWHISLFVDARYTNDNAVRRLITFPDGSEIQLVGHNQVRYWDGNIRRRITLPESIPSPGWAHIGVQMSNGNRTAEFYYNGFLLDSYTNNVPFMEMSVGQLYVGSNPVRGGGGFRGWIDEFKVIAHHSGDESWCNHANGTLIGINGTDQWSNTASGYPQFAHNGITNFLNSFGKQTYNQYACYHDYSDDYAGGLANVPAQHDRVGDDYNFPEGPLVHDQPRPESRNNAFCLECHTANGLPGLDLAALALNTSVNAVDDPRRQPLQALPRVFGNIPASWLAPGLPAVSMVAPSNGLPIDPILAGVDPSLSTTPTDPVVFYQGANFTGTSWALTEGVYPFFDVRTGPIGQDRISSIEIPAGYVVRICDRTGGGDPCGDFTSDQATLGALNNVTNHIEITLQ